MREAIVACLCRRVRVTVLRTESGAGQNGLVIYPHPSPNYRTLKCMFYIIHWVSKEYTTVAQAKANLGKNHLRYPEPSSICRSWHFSSPEDDPCLSKSTWRSRSFLNISIFTSSSEILENLILCIMALKTACLDSPYSALYIRERQRTPKPSHRT